MTRHEGRAETGREGRLRLGDALLRAGDARRIAREEVIHRLLRRQPRDRRQHAEGVGRQHHDVLRRLGDARGERVGDELDGIAGARVLGVAAVIKIERTGGRIVHHVLQDRAEALGGGIDLGLGLARELDHLGVATTFEVEQAVVGPAVLVVADQRA